jgi:ferredoxin
MKKVVIQPGCISCATCQFHCPEVFEVSDVSRIKEGADLEKFWNKVKKAERECPVSVIKCQES